MLIFIYKTQKKINKKPKGEISSEKINQKRTKLNSCHGTYALHDTCRRRGDGGNNHRPDI